MLPTDYKKIFLMARNEATLPNKNLRNWGFSDNECWLHFESYHMPNNEEAFVLALENFLEGKKVRSLEITSSPKKLHLDIIVLKFIS